ncbi:MAG: rod shape-determining protein RodA [Proteobacteria bacterium]|nr:rod shape-determining protein RodA [Pseudomonadota bacterium]
MSDIGSSSARLRRGDMSPVEKIWQMSWSLLFIVGCIFAFGFAMLYSAAGGNLEPWAGPQLARFIFGIGVVTIVAVTDVRIIMRFSYLFYFVVLLMLIAVDILGFVGKGAQRWIDLGFISLQPSELMKPAIILALARYFQGVTQDEIGNPLILLVPLGLILAPAILVILQPDLGTAMLIMMSAAIMLFMAGVRMWKFAVVAAAAIPGAVIAWSFLHDYQRNRVLTFLNPESDPLGTGYHILQSKIAFGSGGLFGKGFMGGTQAHLNFLPERQTDFIATMLAEELGMIGLLALLMCFIIFIGYGYAIAIRCRHQFGRLVAVGLTASFFLYVFINIGMVMGLLPVVGVPLPFVSYGGTSLLTLMFSVGVLMNIYVHRDTQMGARGGFNDF